MSDHLLAVSPELLNHSKPRVEKLVLRAIKSLADCILVASTKITCEMSLYIDQKHYQPHKKTQFTTTCGVACPIPKFSNLRPVEAAKHCPKILKKKSRQQPKDPSIFSAPRRFRSTTFDFFDPRCLRLTPVRATSWAARKLCEPWPSGTKAVWILYMALSGTALPQPSFSRNPQPPSSGHAAFLSFSFLFFFFF